MYQKFQNKIFKKVNLLLYTKQLFIATKTKTCQEKLSILSLKHPTSGTYVRFCLTSSYAKDKQVYIYIYILRKFCDVTIKIDGLHPREDASNIVTTFLAVILLEG